MAMVKLHLNANSLEKMIPSSNIYPAKLCFASVSSSGKMWNSFNARMSVLFDAIMPLFMGEGCPQAQT